MVEIAGEGLSKAMMRFGSGLKFSSVLEGWRRCRVLGRGKSEGWGVGAGVELDWTKGDMNRELTSLTFGRRCGGSGAGAA